MEAQLAQAGEQRRRGRRAAHRDGDRVGERVRRGMMGDADLHGRRAAHVRHVLRLEQLPDARRIGRAQAHVRAADGRDGPGEAPAVAVEHRERPQVDRPVAEAIVEDVAQGVEVGAPVRAHDALRPAGGARGVVDRDERVLVVRGAGLHPARVAGGEQVLVGVAWGARVVDPDRLQPREVEALQRSDERRVDEQETRARVAEDVADLRRREAHVDRHHHAPGERHPEVRLEHCGRVRAEQRHAVPAREPSRPQGARQPSAAVGQLRVGVPARPVDHRRAVGEDACRAVQEGHRAQLGAVDRTAHALASRSRRRRLTARLAIDQRCASEAPS